MAEYFRRGLSKIHFTAVLTSVSAPSIAQITSNGEGLSARIADITGWEFENSPISTPKLSTTFTTTIPGEDTSPNPQLTLYDSDTADTVRALLAKGQAGWMVLCPYGYTATKGARVFPCTSTGVNDQWTVGNEAAQYAVTFAVTAAPTLNAVLAA